jgi:hypothetical protein
LLTGDVDRIVRGEKPDDLPVQQPAEFERALRLDLPVTVLSIADEVIE